MFCRNCGSNIDDRAVICPHCGVPTNNMPQPAQQPYGAPVQNKAVNGFAIAGLVVSLMGLFGGNYLFLIPSIVGLILSIVGMVKSKSYSLYGLAIAALIVSIVTLIIWGIIWIAAFAIIINGFGWDENYPGVASLVLSLVV